MFGFLTTFLAGPYGFLLKIVAVVTIVGGLYLFGYKKGVDSMEPKVEAAQSEAALWQKTAENRLAIIQAQNQAVEGLKAAHDMRLAEQRKKLAAARTEAEKWRDAAQRREEILANLELPPGECDALFSLVDTARGMR